jgi:hypothetical protein
MKSTYAAPTVTGRGDVVYTTLTGKPNLGAESGVIVGPSSGSNLSFGL